MKIELSPKITQTFYISEGDLELIIIVGHTNGFIHEITIIDSEKRKIITNFELRAIKQILEKYNFRVESKNERRLLKSE